MNRFFAGNKLASFFRSTSAIIEDTTAGRFDSTLVSNAIRIIGGTEYITTKPFLDAASTTTLWLHFDIYSDGWTGATSASVDFVNSSGVVVAQLLHNGSSNTMQFQYWNGSAFVNYGSSFSIVDGIRYTLDLKIVCGASGTIDIWKAGTLVASASSGMNAAVTNIAKCRYYGLGSPWVSQMIGIDVDTRAFRYLPSAINGNGFHTDGSGTYSDINETPMNESTAIALPAVSDAKSFTKASITVPSGYSIDSAWINGRGRAAGGIVTDGKLGFRSGGADYLSAGKAFNSGYEPRGHYAATDPATGLAWTQSGYNSAEPLVQAA